MRFKNREAKPLPNESTLCACHSRELAQREAHWHRDFADVESAAIHVFTLFPEIRFKDEWRAGWLRDHERMARKSRTASNFAGNHEESDELSPEDVARLAAQMGDASAAALVGMVANLMARARA